MKKIVIVGSASLQDKIQLWKKFLEDDGFEILDYSHPIAEDVFIEEYPTVHKSFLNNIENADVVFVMNEDKKGVVGYVGAESYAEMAFAVAQNLLHKKNIEVILLQMPDKSVQSYDEVVLWLKLGWIKLFNK